MLMISFINFSDITNSKYTPHLLVCLSIYSVNLIAILTKKIGTREQQLQLLWEHGDL